jgi:ketosteroid isomerase-like protein
LTAVRFAIAFIILVGCGGTRAEFAPSDREAIKKILDDQMAAWNRGDLDAYMEGYAKTDDLIFTSGGNVRVGWQVAFDHYRKRYAQDRAAMGKLMFGITRVDPVGADGAVVLGTWLLTNSPADGRGVFSLVMVRRPEGWRVIHDHTSVAPPPAGQ